MLEDKDIQKLKEELRTKKADTYFQEMVMLSHKVDRNEKWIQQLSNKLGIKLEY